MTDTRHEKEEGRGEEDTKPINRPLPRKVAFIVFLSMLILILLCVMIIKAEWMRFETREGEMSADYALLQRSHSKQASRIGKLMSMLPPDYCCGIEAVEEYLAAEFIRVPKELRIPIAVAIVNYSRQYKVPYELIVGIGDVESDFDPFRISAKRARGILQVRGELWGGMLGLKDIRDLHQIDAGIEAGIRVFKHYLDGNDGGREGDLHKALYLYVGKDKTYVTKVFNAMGKFVLFRANME